MFRNKNNKSDEDPSSKISRLIRTAADLREKEDHDVKQTHILLREMKILEQQMEAQRLQQNSPGNNNKYCDHDDDEDELYVMQEGHYVLFHTIRNRWREKAVIRNELIELGVCPLPADALPSEREIEELQKRAEREEAKTTG